ncbi:GLTP1 [Symbiodinium sp. CCMP2456]|nr:GLTP1 [Symbiodinium sp. CCMP2456]
MPPPWPPRSDDQALSHQVLGAEDGQAKEATGASGMGYVVAEAEVPAVLKAPSPAPEPIPARVVPHDTRFGQLLEKFRDCEIREGGKMQDVILDKFFEACELYRDMLSKLGRAASVVVGDIEHNLGKSKAVYLEAPEERKTFTAYLQLPASHLGIEKITWLLRGVEFFLTMIKLIFTPESGGNPAVEAYQQTLMQYHGWMLQQTVKLGMRAMPSKEGIVQSEGLVLGDGDASPEQRKALCERDAPPASAAGIEVVKWMIELMKIEGKWDAKKA